MVEVEAETQRMAPLDIGHVVVDLPLVFLIVARGEDRVAKLKKTGAEEFELPQRGAGEAGRRPKLLVIQVTQGGIIQQCRTK